MRTRVLFLGGAYHQIPIIKEAKKRNWYVITCDYLPNNPGHKYADEYYNVSTTDFEGVLDLAKRIKPDYVIAYASDPSAPVAAYVSEQLGLPGNSYQSVKTLSEKDLFRAFLREHGFNTPKFVTITRSDNFDIKLRSLSLPLIIKPTDSSGSKGVRRVDNLDCVNEVIEGVFDYSRNGKLIVEEFIDYNECQMHGDGLVANGELVFTCLGDHHFCSTVNPFVPIATTWPTKHKKEITDLAVKEINRLLKLLKYIIGLINIEVRVDKNGSIYIMEVGPRSGGNFVPQAIQYATGFDMVNSLLDLLTGQEVVIPDKSQKFAAYYAINSDEKGTLERITLEKDISPFIKEFHQYVFPGEEVKPFVGANAALGVILLAFDNREEMDDVIKNIDSLIKVQLK